MPFSGIGSVITEVLRVQRLVGDDQAAVGPALGRGVLLRVQDPDVVDCVLEGPGHAVVTQVAAWLRLPLDASTSYKINPRRPARTRCIEACRPPGPRTSSRHPHQVHARESPSVSRRVSFTTS